MRRSVVALALIVALAWGAGRPGGSAAAPQPAPEPGARPWAAPGLAAGRLLVASRQLRSPPFARSVILLLDHDDGGTVGLIVNRPTKLELREILPEEERLAERADRAWFGGPVELGVMFLLVRSEAALPGARRVAPGVQASTAAETLRALTEGEGQGGTFRAYLGYAGWAPRQLAGEIERGDWHVAPAELDEAERVFSEDPESVWKELIESSEGRYTREPRLRRADAAPSSAEITRGSTLRQMSSRFPVPLSSE